MVLCARCGELYQNAPESGHGDLPKTLSLCLLVRQGCIPASFCSQFSIRAALSLPSVYPASFSARGSVCLVKIQIARVFIYFCVNGLGRNETVLKRHLSLSIYQTVRKTDLKEKRIPHPQGRHAGRREKHHYHGGHVSQRQLSHSSNDLQRPYRLRLKPTPGSLNGGRDRALKVLEGTV